ncbi:cache domain-containing protein [Sulfurimonas sp. HSL3-7]|uniref:cache domain-containing protein n=1 Tax=Sulfonitrofixus jiaomeiensis TaxID=3131938 RepID=UPI0031F964E1
MRFTVARFANIFLALLLMSAFAASSAAKERVDVVSQRQPSEDKLIKSEVETAVSMLQAIFAKHQEGEMSLAAAKKLGADLLRELRYGSEGYFWADTTEGINVVLYGRKDVEGKNRIDAKDQNGTLFIREFLKTAKNGGGYVEYWFPKRGESVARPKRSYVLLFKPFGWIIGSGYYR